MVAAQALAAYGQGTFSAQPPTDTQTGPKTMLIDADDFEAIASGRFDTAFRKWIRPTVKAGGTLKTKVGLLAIKAITDMAPEDVTAAEAQRAGFGDVADFRAWLDTMKPGHLFQRIEVGYLGDG